MQYKLVFGLTDLKLSEFFAPYFHRTNSLHRHQYQLYLLAAKAPLYSTDIHTESYTHGMNCRQAKLI